MSHNLNSFGIAMGLNKGDTRSLDYRSCRDDRGNYLYNGEFV